MNNLTQFVEFFKATPFVKRGEIILKLIKFISLKDVKSEIR